MTVYQKNREKKFICVLNEGFLVLTFLELESILPNISIHKTDFFSIFAFKFGRLVINEVFSCFTS